MSEEQVKEVIEQIGYQEFYRYYEDKDVLIRLQKKEMERLNNIINELENLIKEDIITNLCEIENKRIGYGQNETDKIWLHNLWGFKKYIINRCDEILKGSDK